MYSKPGTLRRCSGLGRQVYPCTCTIARACRHAHLLVYIAIYVCIATIVKLIIISLCCLYTDLSNTEQYFLSIATIIIAALCSINLFLEGLQIIKRKLKYFMEWRNYVEISSSSLAICFVLSMRFNDCYCPSASEWQLGSVAIFLAWIDLILLINAIPFVALSINMLISIMKSFLKFIFLPLLLIVSFGIPFFLLFHEPVNHC